MMSELLNFILNHEEPFKRYIPYLPSANPYGTPKETTKLCSL